MGRILEFNTFYQNALHLTRVHCATFYQNALRYKQLKNNNTRKFGGWERASFAAQTQSFLCGKFSTARLEVLRNLRHAGVFQISTMLILGTGFQFKSLWPVQALNLTRRWTFALQLRNTADKVISRKIVGKSARDNPERYCGWFLVHCFSKKFQTMAREAMDVCLRVLKESNKSRFDNYRVKNSVLIIPHITFRDCHVHSFSDNLSRNSCIEIAAC